ncbi:ornithine carbamoyltransferase [Marvinbryantia formatexigens]|uniref:ornithine carbamoyltransferase n=1 Tax=Marvinbryantia formatexigens TaxID=168384 RepID=UPI001F60689B|nr:peptide transporter [Marvinbryantia formatexigens]UWO25824.1 peptide transporter [Marvinbryantia formatexigens DSM 14469]
MKQIESSMEVSVLKSLIRLTDYNVNDIYDIFALTDEVRKGKYRGLLKGKSVILFFPDSSIRTRVTFEKGIYLLGGQSILFPMETLDKKEDIRDVCGYLNNWADLVIVRHKDIHLLEQISACLRVPVINAMTDVNHPCEVLADMYTLSKIRKDFIKDSFLFVGERGNIGLAWKEASEVMGFSLEQCCGIGYEIEGLTTYNNIRDAVMGKDIVCTDPLPAKALVDFKECHVTTDVMKMANDGAILNPCPPFYRGEEVSEEVIESDYFVGYEFKKYLLEVQQAIMIYCLTR